MKLLPLFFCGIFLVIFSATSQDEQLINPSSSAANDHHSTSIGLRGSLAIAGAPDDNEGLVDQGSAYIYRYDGALWNEEQKLTASDAVAGDRFGVSVDIEGDIAVIGAPNSSSSGAVYVFRFNGVLWIEEEKIIPADGDLDDLFGHAVSISGSTILIGSYKDDDENTNAGAAYFYSFDGVSWGFDQKVSYNFGSVDDFFGYDVELDGGRAVIGAYLDDDNGVNSGSAFVYDYNGSNWTLTQKLIASNGTTGDSFGFSVSLWNDLIVCGAYANSDMAAASGAVYVYSLQGTWQEDTILYASDGLLDDWFGYSVSADSTSIFVGAFHNDDFGTESGSAYLFRNDGNSWIEEFNLRASDAASGDEYGAKVKVSGMQLMVGSPQNDDNGTGSGAVYFYPLCTYTPVQEICLASVDNSINDNILIWSKDQTTFIDSFIIYRDGTPVSSIDYNMDGEYIDPVNPQFGSNTYAMSALNHCNIESDTSVNHSTIHLTGSYNTSNEHVLTWNACEGFGFNYYNIWRDTIGNGNFHLIYATLNSQLSYTDAYSPQTPPTYYIEVDRGQNCNSGSTSQNYVRSNIMNFASIGIEEYQVDISLFPNPGNGSFRIECPVTGVISIFNNLGKLVYQNNFDRKGNYSLNLDKGIYQVRITNKDQVISRSLVIQ